MTFSETSCPTRILLLGGAFLCGTASLASAEDRSSNRRPLDVQFATPWTDSALNAKPKTFPLDPLEIAPHRHVPVDVDARPIVRRYKVRLNRPRRVIQGAAGALIVADWGDGSVIKVAPDGETTLLASELNEPAGLAFDASGNLYVANHGGGLMQQGNVIRIAPDGEITLFVEDLNGPTALAFDAHGDLFVADFQSNRILRVTPGGIVHPFIENVPTPAALAFDINGYLYTASSTEGTVYRISPMGNVEILARGLVVPSDLALDPEQHLIVTNFGGTELSYVDPMGFAKTFALVPKGTIGIRFDSAGNLIFVNWDYQTLMKVTTHLQIPCPHCNKTIPLRLRPAKVKPPNEAEPESDGPII